MNTTELVVEKGPEKNSGPHRFEPMTTVIPDLTSQLTSQANKPTGRWLLCWFQINPPSGE